MQGILTSDIVKNLQSRVANTNQYALKSGKFCKPFKRYETFMKCRKIRLQIDKERYAKAFQDIAFCDDLIEILRLFQMDERGSILVPRNEFQNTLVKAGSDFDKLASARIVSEGLNLKQNLGNEIVDSKIKRIYGLFSDPRNLTESGGIVIASKTMHFILPELFIMIDNRVMTSLHEILDYSPHATDGTWYDALPEYHGETLNPYQGTWNWSRYVCYSAALMYYKRIIKEWCQENNSGIKGFSNLDIEYNSTPSRIIDKALW